jgi:hypothetical protein
LTDKSKYLVGKDKRLFADPSPGPDETSFHVNNTSAAYYASPYYKKHKKDTQPIPPPRSTPPRIDLADIVGPEILKPITAAKRLRFHAVGDTGAAKVDKNQTMLTAIQHEAGVANAMAADLGSPESPAFFLHLGDVIYSFGEGQYYYDQFYEPFRNYDRPIFALAGNHDGVVFGPSPDTPSVETLTAFLRNFCAPTPGPAEDAAGLMRSRMTQPGVYFTLDAPFVSIVCLYSNVLEDVGVISSQGGRFPTVGDEQLHFLRDELKRLKAEREAGERAVIIACHHPPASVDSKHGGTEGIAEDIDWASREAGFWPDAVISGHAHLYQRFTRRVDGREIPYVVAGAGGYSETPPHGGATAHATDGEYTLVAKPIVSFGYLTVTADIGVQRLKIEYTTINPEVDGESVVVDLKKGKLL